MMPFYVVKLPVPGTFLVAADTSEEAANAILRLREAVNLTIDDLDIGRIGKEDYGQRGAAVLGAISIGITDRASIIGEITPIHRDDVRPDQS